MEMVSGVLPFVGFVIVFPVFWLGVVWVVSQLSGWRQLSEQFSTERSNSGDRFTWVSGRLRFFSNYNNVLVAYISPRGLGLETSWFFKFAHEPLFIPWTAVRRIEHSRHFFNYVTKLAIAMPDGGAQTITLYGQRIGESIDKHAAPPQ